MGRSETDIKQLCPGAKVKKGLAIPGAEVARAGESLEKWISNEGKR